MLELLQQRLQRDATVAWKTELVRRRELVSLAASLAQEASQGLTAAAVLVQQAREKLQQLQEAAGPEEALAAAEAELAAAEQRQAAAQAAAQDGGECALWLAVPVALHMLQCLTVL